MRKICKLLICVLFSPFVFRGRLWKQSVQYVVLTAFLHTFATTCVVFWSFLSWQAYRTFWSFFSPLSAPTITSTNKAGPTYHKKPSCLREVLNCIARRPWMYLFLKREEEERGICLQISAFSFLLTCVAVVWIWSDSLQSLFLCTQIGTPTAMLLIKNKPPTEILTPYVPVFISDGNIISGENFSLNKEVCFCFKGCL